MRLDGDEIMLTDREVEIMSIFVSDGILSDAVISEELKILIRKLDN